MNLIRPTTVSSALKPRLRWLYLFSPGTALTLEALAVRIGQAPAAVAKSARHALDEGAPADLMLADLNQSWTVDRFRMASDR